MVETTQVYLSFTQDSIIDQQVGHSGVGLILSPHSGTHADGTATILKAIICHDRVKGELWETPHWKGDVVTIRHFCLPPTGQDEWHRPPGQERITILPKDVVGKKRAPLVQYWCSLGTPGILVPPRLPFDHRTWASGEEMHEVSSRRPWTCLFCGRKSPIDIISLIRPAP